MRSQCTEYLQNVKRKQVNLQMVDAEWRRPPESRMRTYFGSGALRPPPPVAAPLVPRFALLPAATPRDVLSAVGTPFRSIASESGIYRAGEAPSCGGWGREGVRSTPKRGSPRGVGSEARAHASRGRLRNDWRRGAASSPEP